VPLLHQKQCSERSGNALLASKQWHTIVAIQRFFNGLITAVTVTTAAPLTGEPPGGGVCAGQPIEELPVGFALPIVG
jgi:hypothetical protein